MIQREDSQDVTYVIFVAMIYYSKCVWGRIRARDVAQWRALAQHVQSPRFYPQYREGEGECLRQNQHREKVNDERSGGTQAQAFESFVSDITQDKLTLPTRSRDNTCEVTLSAGGVH